MRRSLRLVLDGEEGVQVIAEAEDMAAAVRHVHDHKPHVLVLDLRMPGGSSIETIGKLRERAPDTQVVVLTMDDNPVFAQRALATGALGFVLKDRADSELGQAVRAAACGEEYVSPRMRRPPEALDESITDDELTSREVEVLRLIALGHTSVEIAGKLRHLAPHRGVSPGPHSQQARVSPHAPNWWVTRSNAACSRRESRTRSAQSPSGQWMLDCVRVRADAP